MPVETRLRPVVLTPSLAMYLGSIAGAAALLAAAFVRPISDPATLIVGAVVTAGSSYFSVRIGEGGDSTWTSSLFVHMALTWSVGPIGAAVAAVSQAGAYGIRTRHGVVRAGFNAANFFLCDLASYYVFKSLGGIGAPGLGVVAGTVAGLTQCLVNQGLLAGVIHISSGGRAPFARVLKTSLRDSVLYNIGYGWAACGAVLLHQRAGAVGFATTLVPVALLQGFLVLLARRIRAQEEERASHAKEREALLQQAIDASDAERKRIASDLHDGVVQTLAGLAFSLAAKGAATNQDEDLLHAADTLRSSVTDLRTLMIEIAPPDLAVGGVDAALKKLLAPLPAKGIEVELDATAATHLPADKTSLVFRVAQEAIRNVVNHSQATHVTTRLLYHDGLVTLEVIDNGKGFTQDDRARRREEGHVGLSLLNNAVETASGRLSLTSEPGRGTSLMLELPCPQ